MSRRLSRISLAFVLIVSGEVWALGLGDITMNSALNEPLNARIELLSATPEELDNLTIALASSDTFARYGIDRPFYLNDMQFSIVRSGRADGNFVQVTSLSPMAEPFLTFLVEASWSRGRLLREYTVFLDPPTFAPPAADTAPAVQAPTRTAPSDSGRIDRTPPAVQPQPTPRPTPRPAPAPRPADTQPQPTPLPEPQPEPQATPEPVVDDRPFSTFDGIDMIVERGDTLWGVASRVRPDSRLTMNQTMLAIFDANPEAFGGNINILRAGAALRIPSADEIFQINRADALAEARRQHAEWGGGTVPAVADTSTRPSLTLVPPDEDIGEAADTFVPEAEPEPETALEPEPDLMADEDSIREQEILDRIAELEGADVPQQQSLIEIRDNELAQLREELARIRGDAFEPLPDEPFVDELDPDALEEVDAETMADDMEDEAVADEAEPTADVIRTPVSAPEPGIVDQILGFVTGIYGIIAAAVILVVGALVWFMRRGRDEDDVEDWQPIDKDEIAAGAIEATETMAAPTGEESFVVVEQEPVVGGLDETIDAEAPPIEPIADLTEEVPAAPVAETAGEPTEFGSLEDTFSSETAINLDQSDPIAEADFHMAYGLYDQAADLVNGALQLEPERSDLLTKLCEIYFVWGNRDAFIDAAGRLKGVVGDGESADWDKIVIMGQQIAAEDELFAGASAAGATKAVDLAFEEGGDETGALDMDLGAGGDDASEILDIGVTDDEDTAALEEGGDAVDFVLDTTGETEVASLDDFDDTAESPTVETGDFEETAESPTIESVDFDITKEMPEIDETAEVSATAETKLASLDDETVDASLADETTSTPTIEEQFDVLSGTAELPSLDDTVGDAIEVSGQSAEETAEINLDDLDLEIDSMAETELASLDDLDSTGKMEALADAGLEEAVEDLAAVTGKNLEIDPDSTGLQEQLSGEDTGVNEALSDTGILEGPDEKLLDATGVTQVLSSDLAVDTTTDAEADIAAEDDSTMLATTLGTEPLEESLPDDAETMLASLDDDADESDFDFAKTEALPKDAFTGELNMDETGEMPAVASTDVELDLDDLTAALEVSDGGDTVEQPRDDATVEQPRPTPADLEDSGTVSLGADDMSDELSEARTMTEVGTKLDLARAYVDMGDPAGARSILEEVLDEGDDGQRQQAQQLLDSLPS